MALKSNSASLVCFSFAQFSSLKSGFIFSLELDHFGLVIFFHANVSLQFIAKMRTNDIQIPVLLNFELGTSCLCLDSSSNQAIMHLLFPHSGFLICILYTCIFLLILKLLGSPLEKKLLIHPYIYRSGKSSFLDKVQFLSL